MEGVIFVLILTTKAIPEVTNHNIAESCGILTLKKVLTWLVQSRRMGSLVPRPPPGEGVIRGLVPRLEHAWGAVFPTSTGLWLG